MDPKDILGLPRNSLPSQDRKSKPPKESQRKPDGISREVCAFVFSSQSPPPPSTAINSLPRMLYLGLRPHRRHRAFDSRHRLYSLETKNTIPEWEGIYRLNVHVPSISVSVYCKNPPFIQITWQWLPFTSSARNDNLQLYHWVCLLFPFFILMCLLLLD